MQAIGRHEGFYGYGWGAAGAGRHNWGAVHRSLPILGQCPADSFLWTSEFNPVTQKRYEVCMKAYPTAQAGAAGLLGNLGPKARPMTWRVLESGDADAIADAMYREHYYGGFHDPKVPGGIEKNKADYANAIEANAANLAEALGEKVLVQRRGGNAEKPGRGSPSSHAEPGGSMLSLLGGAGLLAWTLAHR